MFEPVRPAASPAPRSDYVQPNLGHGLRIWWAFYWPAELCTMVFAVVWTLTVRHFMEDPRVPMRTAWPLSVISPFVILAFYYAVAFFVMAYILRKKFRHFRIGLLSNHGGEGAETLAPTLRRTARVWWAFTWRAVIYRLIVVFVASFPLGWVVGFLSALLRGPAYAAAINVTTQVIIDGAVGIFVIYSGILDEDISDFRVALLPLKETTGEAIEPAAVPASLSNG